MCCSSACNVLLDIAQALQICVLVLRETLDRDMVHAGRAFVGRHFREGRLQRRLGLDLVDQTWKRASGVGHVERILTSYHTTTRSERTYRYRRTCRFGVMCAEQGACVRRRSWAGYTINMFEFEFPTGTGMRRKWLR
jgi:hypothetical protein